MITRSFYLCENKIKEALLDKGKKVGRAWEVLRKHSLGEDPLMEQHGVKADVEKTVRGRILKECECFARKFGFYLEGSWEPFSNF